MNDVYEVWTWESGKVLVDERYTRPSGTYVDPQTFELIKVQHIPHIQEDLLMGQ